MQKLTFRGLAIELWLAYKPYIIGAGVAVVALVAVLLL